MTLPIRVVTTETELLRLEPGWDALSAVSGTPFQSPAWLLAWWRQFGDGHPVVAVAGDDPIVGLLACTVREDGGRRLLPMGAGTSDYCDALVAPGAPEDTVSLLLAAIVGATQGVAACDLIDVPPDASLRRASLPRGWAGTWHETVTCPVLRLDGSVRDAVPARMHRKLRMNRNRAARLGGWTSGVAGEAEFGEQLARLVALHGARWASRRQPGVFADARVRLALEAACPGLQRAKRVELHVLRFAGAVAAACLALRHRERLMLYLSGIDPAHQFWSPGTVLLGDMLERAVADGVREIDFLRGSEAYKYAWGAVDRRNAEWRLRRA